MNEIKRVLIHIRWPLQSFTLLGLLFGLVVFRIDLSAELFLGLIAWCLLCSGITVFNSYYDQDQKPVAGLEHPPVATSALLIGAWLMKLSGLLIALFLNKLFLTAYISGIILSILYSHERFRFKSNGYLAVFFNFVVGAMTFFVPSTFASPSPAVLLFGCAASGAFLAAIYLMMQVHQRDEDSEREDHSVMLQMGKRRTLAGAMVMMMGAAVWSLITIVLANYLWFYIVILIAYFATIVFFSYLWWKKQEEPLSDFKMMNKLTMRLSYAANIILIATYIYEMQ